MKIPANTMMIGPCEHPADGQPGVAIQYLATGIEVFFDGAGATRSLPSNWRDSQPATVRPLTKALYATICEQTGVGHRDGAADTAGEAYARRVCLGLEPVDINELD